MLEQKSPTYKRLPDLERKQLLIDATIDCLSTYSLSGTTVRRIAEIAGVTPGLVTHHFNSKEDLIAEAYRYMADKYLREYQRVSDNASENEIERLKSFISVMFQPETLDRNVLKIWTGFWTLVLSDKRVEAVHRSTAKRTRRHLSILIQQALEFAQKPVDQAKTDDLAIMILSLVDGMWLTWGLDPTVFDSIKARNLVLDVVAKQLDLPQLLE